MHKYKHISATDKVTDLRDEKRTPLGVVRGSDGASLVTMEEYVQGEE